MEIPNIHPQSQGEIIAETKKVWQELAGYLSQLERMDFYKKVNDEVWSVAENLEHLILSTKPLTDGLKVPKLMLRAMGKPNRQLRDFQEVAGRYREKLAAAGDIRQSNFGPKVNLEDSIEDRVKLWEETGAQYFDAIAAWKEDELDKFLMPHPLLGKMIVREMLFFTLYHTYHHLDIMKNRAEMGK
ncbi:MAG: DinB family protein [Bacteroidia bacterium]|nr:DinB family protein [Bacteroidia bacterium]